MAANDVGLLRLKDKVIPADLHLMNYAGIKKIYKLYDFSGEVEAILDIIDDAVLSVGHGSRAYSTKTGLTSHLRYTNSISRNCKSIMLIVPEVLFKAAIASDYIPRWLERLADTAKALQLASRRSTLLCWGEPSRSVEDTLLKIQGSAEIRQLEYFESDDWKPFEYWNTRATEQTAFSKKWAEVFASSGGMMDTSI